MEQKPRFKIVYTEEAIDFLRHLPQKVKAKVVYNIGKSMYVLDNSLFKKLENTDVWEFRTLYNGNAYRLFAFWDTEEDTLVIATHGMIKKSQRTPLKEIEKAEAKKKEYFMNKG
ncbi:type II toxin-antitoxin system RelE/ParE family toxin [Segatella oris]|uniref:type II toxin-antitoxin system RelE/ParE family toxin n=1 Tax=Segatella oris TaxID=28135 RepID=UPI0028F04500|nr:type II toxin-antitoxin system RelE/ParE family toxin [Segatella oris]